MSKNIKQIHQLIHSLNKKELTKVEQYLIERFPATSPIRNAFNFLKEKESPTKQLTATKYPNVTINRLRTILSEIIQQIDRQNSEDIDERIINHISVARIMIRRQQYDWGFNELEKAQKLAEKYELLSYQLLVRIITTNIYSVRFIAPKNFQRSETAQAIVQLISEFEEYIKHRIISVDIGGLSREKQFLSKEEIENFDLPSTYKGEKIWYKTAKNVIPPAENLNFWSKDLYYSNLSIYYKLTNNFESHFECLNARKELFDCNAQMIDYRFVSYKGLMYDRTFALLVLKKYEEALANIQEFKLKLDKYSKSFPSKIYYLQYLIFFELETNYRLMKEGKVKPKQLEKLLKIAHEAYQKNYDSFDVQGKIYTIFSLTIFCFSIEKYEEAHLFLEKYLQVHSLKSDIRPDYYVCALMLDIVIPISEYIKSLKNNTNNTEIKIEYLKDKIRNHKRTLHRHKYKWKSNNYIFDFCEAVIIAKKPIKSIILEHQLAFQAMVKTDKIEKARMSNGIKWHEWYERLLKYV